MQKLNTFFILYFGFGKTLFGFDYRMHKFNFLRQVRHLFYWNTLIGFQYLKQFEFLKGNWFSLITMDLWKFNWNKPILAMHCFLIMNS